MKKTFRYNFRLKPSAEQEAKLVEFGAYARGVWNLLLSENMCRYQCDKTFVFYHEMASLIKDLKKFDELSWLKAFDPVTSQQVARDLEVALKNSFTNGRAQQFPIFKISFKLKKLHDDSFRFVNNSNCIRIEEGTISIPKVGKVGVVHLLVGFGAQAVLKSRPAVAQFVSQTSGVLMIVIALILLSENL